MIEWLRRWFQERAKRRRALSILNTYGCVLYCTCGEILNEYPAETAPAEGRYTYLCRSCGALSTFDFDLAPVPIKVRPEAATWA